jgi:hypothetical protein
MLLTKRIATWRIRVSAEKPEVSYSTPLYGSAKGYCLMLRRSNKEAQVI